MYAFILVCVRVLEFGRSMMFFNDCLKEENITKCENERIEIWKMCIIQEIISL